MSELFVPEEVRRALALLFRPKEVWEVRAIGAQLQGSPRVAPVSGYFNDTQACVTCLSELYRAERIYVTLNPVKGDLLSRRKNRLAYAERDSTTKDHHVQEQLRLLIDVDPDRPSGISASKEEKVLAGKKACVIRDFLKARGWPDPVICDSGNGYHLVYWVVPMPRIDELLKKVLGALADHFDGDGVTLDRTVYNSSRIVKLWGTKACKGDNTEERPWRLSQILKQPERLDKVTGNQLQALVRDLSRESPPPKSTSSHKGTFDMEEFLSRHGVEVQEKLTESDGTIKWRLKHCPFYPDHESPDAAVFQRPDGVLGFKCFHNHCIDKHWQDFRRHFEPKRSKTDKAEAKEPEAQSWQDPQPLPEDLPAVPPFDYKCLPETLCPHIKDIAERMQCPPDFPAVGVMIALGSVVGRKIGIRPKRRDDWVEIPNLWGLVIGRPGVLKTPALQQALVHLRRLVANAYEEFEKAKREYEVNTMLAAQHKKIVEDEIKQLLKGKKDKKDDEAKQ